MVNPIDIIVAGAYKGKDALKAARGDVTGLSADAKKTGLSLGEVAKGAGLAFGAVGVAAGAMAAATAVAWSTLKEGAVLMDTKDDFDSLAASIGTTADALEGRLSAATGGLVSNATMIADATKLMGTNLGLTADEVVAFSGMAAELGWNLDALGDTLNTKMTRGLKELGINVTVAKDRIKELEAAGYSADEAFKMAVMEGGAKRIELVGKLSEEAAGKIVILENVVTDMQNAFKESFAREMSDDLSALAGAGVEAGAGMVTAAEGAAMLAANMAKPIADVFIGSGMLMQIRDVRDQIGALSDDMEDNGKIRRLWLEATLPGTSIERMAELLAEAQALMVKVNGEVGRAGPPWQAYAANAGNVAGAVDEATAAVREFGEVSKTAIDDFASFADVPANFASIAGNAINNQITAAAEESAAAAAEAHAEAAQLIQDRYTEAAAAMSSAFMGALSADVMPDFSNVDAAKQSAFDMAGAFGLSVPILSDIGVQMGVIDEATAQAAAKAALFQGAVAVMNEQLAAGILSPEAWTAGIDGLISTLGSMTPVEIQVALTAKQESIDAINAMSWLPEGAKAAMIKQVEFKPEDAALQTVMGLIDGIPDNDEKIVTFTPEGQAVLDTVTDIQTAVTGVDGTVTMAPEAATVFTTITDIDRAIKAIPGEVQFVPLAKSVFDTIDSINGRHITVYVDYVSTGDPGKSGRSTDTTGTNRSSDTANDGGTTPTNRSGSAVPPPPSNRGGDSFAEFYAQLAREGVSW